MVTPPEDGISDSFVAAVAPLSAIEADLLVVTVFGFTAFFLPTDGFLFKKLFWNPNEEDFGLEVRAWVGVPVPVPLPLPSGFAGFLRPSFCLWDSSSSINANSSSRLEIRSYSSSDTFVVVVVVRGGSKGASSGSALLS